jgi:hypothetical protein
MCSVTLPRQSVSTQSIPPTGTVPLLVASMPCRCSCCGGTLAGVRSASAPDAVPCHQPGRAVLLLAVLVCTASVVQSSFQESKYSRAYCPTVCFSSSLIYVHLCARAKSVNSRGGRSLNKKNIYKILCTLFSHYTKK